MYLPHNTKTLDATHETIVAKFGSRLSMNFRPQSSQIFLSPIGRFFDKPYEINFGILIDGVEYGLGFGYRQKKFQYIEQHEYFDRVVYRCKDFDLGLDCKFEFISPFVAKNKEIADQPVIYINFIIDRFIDRCVKKDDDRMITVFVDARMTDFQEEGCSLHNKTRYFLTDDHIHYQDTVYLNDFLKENSYHKKGIEGELEFICLDDGAYIDGKKICIDGRISQHHTFKTTFALCGYCEDEILLVENKKYKLSYTNKYKCLSDVVESARIYGKKYIEASNFFRNSLESSSLGKSFINLLGLSFRSFAMNTWWARSGDEEWFSVAEGNCLFHSTVDVEYNNGLFYFILWPELIEYNFKFWSKYKSQGHLNHDVGAILNGGKQGYPHAMEIEENSDFILMLFAYYRMLGKKDTALKYMDLVKELIFYNKSCDLTGNGLPNKGTANTIDDSSDDVQFAEEQVYLGIKEYAAYIAASRLFELLDDQETIKICKKEANKILNTIETKGWLEDHYAVTLISSNGKINEYSLYQCAGGNVSEKGKDAYSIYTANGLLYLWLINDNGDFSIDRLCKDAISAHKACSTPFGDTHSSVDTSNIWISQNIWRDLCAGYLGINMNNNIENYWEYEVYENQGGRGGCFIDTCGWNKLNYYPRGLTCLGYFMSTVGLTIDSIKKEITFKPCEVPCKMPILQFADWENNKVPFIDFYLEDNKINFNISNKELLSDYIIKLR